jgi:hypothetical protein
VPQQHRMTAQRVQQTPSARPLPSFEMPWLEVVDPDRTLKRPAIRVESRVPPSANSTEEISVEDVLEVVNVGRVPPKPVSPEATQEITAEDVIGVVAAVKSPVPSPSYPSPRITVVPEPPAWPTSRRSLEPPPRVPLEERADLARLEASKPPSIAPVALDNYSRSRADSTFLLEDTPYGLRAPRMGLAVAAGLGAMVGIFVLVFALGSAGAKPVVQVGAHAAPQRAPVAVAAAAPARTPTSETRSSAVPTMDIASLPQAPVGTVSLAPLAKGHRLYVDGSVVTSGSAIVGCGKHLVKVGSKGHTQEVTVPCGGDVVIDH